MQITWARTESTPVTPRLNGRLRAFADGQCVGWVQERRFTGGWSATLGEPAPGSSWVQEGQVTSEKLGSQAEAMTWVETMFAKSTGGKVDA